MNRELRYCTKCVMPETAEGITFNENGICQACQSYEQKQKINWVERKKQLAKIFEEYKSRSGDNYDCLVPISGGKDSTYQLYVVKELYGLKPLAVTFSHNWFSETGKFNLWNTLEKLNIDHIMFTPNRELVNKLAKQSLIKIGDACWTCHAGVGAFPMQVAVKWNIPLIVWGESASEYYKASYDNPIKYDYDYFMKISQKCGNGEMLCKDITAKDLFPFNYPSLEEYKKVGIVGIHLGDYIKWDTERQVELIKRKFGWQECDVEGTYKRYKSVECIMPGVHDYAKYLKRGFGRATDHACGDILNGKLTREEAFELVKQYDPVRPKALDYFLEITGLEEAEFYEIMNEHRKGCGETWPGNSEHKHK
jgi:N-acetyl sugar amidotransferase